MPYLTGVLSSAPAAPVPPALFTAGLKLLPLPAGVVDGGGVRMNNLCGLSLTGSSSAAAGDPFLAPSTAAVAGLAVPQERLYGDPPVAAAAPERLPGLLQLLEAVPRPNLGVVVRRVSSGEGRMDVTAARTGR